MESQPQNPAFTHVNFVIFSVRVWIERKIKQEGVKIVDHILTNSQRNLLITSAKSLDPDQVMTKCRA